MKWMIVDQEWDPDKEETRLQAVPVDDPSADPVGIMFVEVFVVTGNDVCGHAWVDGLPVPARLVDVADEPVLTLCEDGDTEEDEHGDRFIACHKTGSWISAD